MKYFGEPTPPSLILSKIVKGLPNRSLISDFIIELL
jgi:hypothetical protein